MKRMTKMLRVVLTGMLAAAQLLAMVPVAFASDSTGVTARLGMDSVYESSEAQTLTLTLKADAPVNIGGFQFTAVIPENFIVEDIHSEDPNVSGLIYTIPKDGSKWNGLVIWLPADVSDKPVSQLATVTITVPAGTKAGSYAIGAKDIRAAGNYGRTWPIYISEPITATLLVRETPDSVDTGSGENVTPPDSIENDSNSGNSKPENTQPDDSDSTTTEQYLMRFSDVKKTHWFYDAVRYVSEHSIMNGVSEDYFSPNSTLTRGMMVTVLWRMNGSPSYVGSGAFRDVEQDTWYTEAVNWAHANGIVQGYGNGLFGPKDNITREQMAVMLYTYAKYTSDSGTAVSDLSQFKDRASVSSWAVQAIRWAVAQDIIHGKSADTLDPAGTATRAEVATILTNYLTKS